MMIKCSNNFLTRVIMLILLFFPDRFFCAEWKSKNATDKILVLYFPQFHEDPLNNELWGKGFSDWNSLNKTNYNRYNELLLLPTELGYYDLLSTTIRRQQGKLARQYSIDGFIYHHYWFHDGSMNATLSAPLEALLIDNQPDLPFALNWVAIPWEATWNGKSKNKQHPTMLKEQFFPSPNSTSILKHYQFLRRFFHHPNYILMDGSPMLFIYNHYNLEPLIIILNQLRILAQKDGFPNLHIVRFHCIVKHNIALGPHKTNNMINDGYNADLYYPGCIIGRNKYRANIYPSWCYRKYRKHFPAILQRPTYLSSITSFDNTPRRDAKEANIWHRNHTYSMNNITEPEGFENDLVIALQYGRCCAYHNYSRILDGGEIVVVNAWNEWGEGMAMEPSNLYGRSFLEAVPKAKKRAQECFYVNK